ncbi:AbrB/MazE/SpoVT family DNA-binding domain-containing protein [Halocatena salina]|uniref:AbrB/MazE/SpoVT family DNA-binding domain-containing protein n=1 Tax=Halocatena salina TaxID=2934340 RepID=A0A8U0A463_9EURY|nr:AbrB/MazE/SpoVT family DNA-binding domain-containing protein [Halocatena salina]UPM44001.1 AbrB/MazE/SpoVT family DNA-binding domain-containing protein [Halocatena salina]
MTDENDGPMWPPALFTRGMQQASEQAMDNQQKLLSQLLEMSDPSRINFGSQLGALSQTATFKTRVQSGGRLSIPDAEREALDIEEGDIVQTIVIPIKRNRDTGETNE